MNSGFLVTEVGLAAAAIATPTGPYVHIAQFRVGSAYNYAPVVEDTGLHGTTLYTGVPSGYTILEDNLVEIMCVMDATVGTFNFGEIGLYLATGELFALSVFSTLQEKIKAIGAQVGNVWRIRALIKLDQAPAIIEVTLINGQNILEVPTWQSLAKPIDQISGANIVIVHESNSSGDPALVIRDTDDEWGLIDYKRTLNSNTADSGAALTTTTYTHPNILNLNFDGMPRSDSKYVAKFPDGSIRRIASQPAPNQIGFTPVIAAGLTGVVSIWEENTGDTRISWADTTDYNNFIPSFNLYWGNSQGPYRSVGSGYNVPYPASNKGSGETQFAALTRRTNTLDWQTLLAAVKAKCELHSIPITDIEPIVDFVYRPISPTFYSLENLRLQWQALLGKIAPLEANRNVFEIAMLESAVTYDTPYNEFWSGIRHFNFWHDYTSSAHQQGMLNSGHEIRVSANVTMIVNPAWTLLNAMLSNMGTLRIKHDTVISSGGVGTSAGIGLQELTGSFQTLWSYTFSTWSILLKGYESASLNRIVLTLDINNTAGTPGYGATPGQINWNWHAYRPSSADFNAPVLTYPVVTMNVT